VTATGEAHGAACAATTRRAARCLTTAIAAMLALAGCGGSDRDAPPGTVTTRPVADTAPTVPPATTPAPTTPVPKPRPQPRRLTLRQAIGQRFVFAYTGTTPPAALRKRIARGEAAGVILFARNVGSVAHLRRTMRSLQRIRRPAGLDAPLLVVVDQEGGLVRRLPGPPAARASDTPSAAAALANGRAAARVLREAGANVDLAPVVDVARAGSVLEREGRTYGRDAGTAVARAGAFAAGLRAGGVAPVLKHFPGFGAATVNTDDAPARIDLPLATLRAVDLVPYGRLRAAAVMLSTAVYPRVDPRPAAFSRRWVTAELRGRLRFRGVTITDDLQTPAVVQYGTPAQLAYFAMRAGADVPLFAKDYETGARAANGLERAVRSGALPRAQLEAGARRVLAWRATLTLAR
jgi:beta-N-acetylhexosaminidase